jgi:4-amino-4-deoxy-L-arabinose transferase-like glycosyltransferase
LSRSERAILWVFAAAAAVLRVAAFFHYRFDSDEQQHLHVAWSWSAGLRPYADTFDNHVPLFHIVTAPLLRLFGERNDILLWMRAPMLLIFGATLVATFVLARRMYGERAAIWSVVLLTLFPPFFLKSLEYRTDNLWTMFCVGAIAVMLIEGSSTRLRALTTGLLLGAALATSLKTLPFMVAIAVAIIVSRRKDLRLDILAAGVVVIPLVITMILWSRGVWDAFIYCAFRFNQGVTATHANVWLSRAIFPVAALLIAFAAKRMRDRTTPLRYESALIVAVYCALVISFWVVVSPRDFLCVMPLLAIFASGALVQTQRSVVWLAAICTIFIASLLFYADGFRNRTAWHTTMMNQALGLSHPGDMLIDYKGETIYRQRPYYYVLESITRAQLAQGLLRDTIPEDVVRTCTHVAQADGAFWPPRGRAFLLANFLDMGRLRAAGQWIQPDGTFTIAVPGEYVIVRESGEAAGMLDGAPYSGAQNLAPGMHHFAGATDERFAILWAPAFQRGYSPFHLKDREF